MSIADLQELDEVKALSREVSTASIGGGDEAFNSVRGVPPTFH